MDSVGEGEGGKIWENGIETCILSCMKRVASPGSMHDTGCLGLVHWDDPEGGYGEGGGRREEGSVWGTHVYLLRIHFDIWQNQYNIVKFKSKIKLKWGKNKTKQKKIFKKKILLSVYCCYIEVVTANLSCILRVFLSHCLNSCRKLFVVF